MARFSFDGAGGVVAGRPHLATPRDTIEGVYRRSVQPLVLQALGLEVLHASAVLTASGVVALCGPTGAGKSTLAAALAQRGYAAWADDALVIDFARGGPEAVRLPFERRLRQPSRAFLGALPEPALAGGGAEPARAPLAFVGLLEPAPAGAPTEIARLAPTAAFPALLPHAVCFTVGDAEGRRRLVTRYLAIASAIPVCTVPVEPRFEALAGLIRRLGAILGPPERGAG